MKHIVLCRKANHPLSFYLAMEEWVAHTLPPDEYFFSWVVDPTVIVGRNQELEIEVDMQYCKDNHINIVRRKSGGGCVYSDLGNIMLSYIAPSTGVETTFSRYTSMVAQFLRSLGLNALATGRNDITVDSRKVSGNAFYHLPGRSIVHGTLLFDTYMPHMLHAITPSRSKLLSKKVKSVGNRIVTLSQYLPQFTTQSLRDAIAQALTDSTITLDDNAIAQICEIEQHYLNPAWTAGHRSCLHRYFSGIIDGVGQLNIDTRISPEGTIADAHISGDFFSLADIDSGILRHIRGAHCSASGVAHALRNIDTSHTIAGLDTETFSKIFDKINSQS